MNYRLAVNEEIKEFDTLVLGGFLYGLSLEVLVLKVYRDSSSQTKSIFVKVIDDTHFNSLPIPYIHTYFKSWKKVGIDTKEGLFLKNIDFVNCPRDPVLTVDRVIHCASDVVYTESGSYCTIGSDGSHYAKNYTNKYRIIRFAKKTSTSSNYGLVYDVFKNIGVCYITQSGYYGYAVNSNFQVAARKARDDARRNELRGGSNDTPRT